MIRLPTASVGVSTGLAYVAIAGPRGEDPPSTLAWSERSFPAFRT